MLPGGASAAEEGPKDMPIILSRTVPKKEGGGEGGEVGEEGKVDDAPKDDSLTFGVGSLFVAR